MLESQIDFDMIFDIDEGETYLVSRDEMGNVDVIDPLTLNVLRSTTTKEFIDDEGFDAYPQHVWFLGRRWAKLKVVT